MTSPDNTVPIELLEKTRPQQQRAIKTYERLLESAAELLDEVGVERISTNLIAERAGITVPALYRYFPNKYALLYALGARLMDRQNEVVLEWFKVFYDPQSPLDHIHHVYDILKATHQVTAEQTGGLAILRSMRVVPVLYEARLKSHYAVSDWICQQLVELLGVELSKELTLRVRLMLEVGTSAIEVAMEDPEMPVELALEEGAKMMELYWAGLYRELGLSDSGKN
ncbi:TetR/AcrR family transcriptional regulator [Pseudomaricurvus sp.]|uniref:TetR/AcrR family transcriptional regulator n=1 Tax=Pseudomaricurvus sp. TaxID=2004510 RepID=UPI003F6BA530